MNPTIQNLVNEGFQVFTFRGIKTKLNAKGEEKKEPIGMPAWKEIRRDNLMEYIKPTEHCACILTGIMSGITVFDFDDIEVYNKLVIDLPEIKNIRTIKTNHGVHLYCLYDSCIKTTTNGFKSYDKVDIRNEGALVFAPPTKYKLLNGSIVEYVDLGGKILPLPMVLIHDLKQTKHVVLKSDSQLINKKRKVTEPDSSADASAEPDSSACAKQDSKCEMEEKENLEYIEEIMEEGYLNFKANTSYNDWRDVGFIFKHTSQTEKSFQLFCVFSKLFDKLHPSDKQMFDEAYTSKFWDTIKQTNKNPLTIKTLKSWVYEQKRAENSGSEVCCSNDKEAGDHLYLLLADKLVYCLDVLYFKKKNIWITNEKVLRMSLRDFVLSSNVYKEPNGDSVPAPYAQNVCDANHIVDVILGKAINNSDDDFYEKFLTTTKTKLCFKNGVLNIKSKVFTLWENVSKADEVFTPFLISRDFNPVRDEGTIQLIRHEIFEKIFSGDSQRALNFYSRGMAGHVEDKVWGLFIGARNCGKGVLENYFKQTFQRYITSINATEFLCERSTEGGDSAKKLSWMMDLEFSRLTFTQECKFDSSNKNVKIDGNKIKKLASGGDVISARKNYQDEREFKIQSTLTFNANDFPPISPLDTMETCTSFSSIKQFKTQDFISKRQLEGACDLELSLYEVGDSDIKYKCSSTLYTDALVHLILDNYVSKPVAFVNKFVEDSNDTNLIAKILSAFEITKRVDDKVTNTELKNWCAENDISLGNKLKPYLKGWGCSEFKSGSRRGIQGLRIIKSETCMISGEEL